MWVEQSKGSCLPALCLQRRKWGKPEERIPWLLTSACHFTWSISFSVLFCLPCLNFCFSRTALIGPVYSPTLLLNCTFSSCHPTFPPVSGPCLASGCTKPPLYVLLPISLAFSCIHVSLLAKEELILPILFRFPDLARVRNIASQTRYFYWRSISWTNKPWIHWGCSLENQLWKSCEIWEPNNTGARKESSWAGGSITQGNCQWRWKSHRPWAGETLAYK